ncbi:hypothetical protein TNCV_1425951 [Trichonephila clavipes]|nr:hypothetical protein TNCV_1425951 [Trichonephila clavipes]
MLLLFVRKILKKTFEPTREKCEWKILYNREIYRKYGGIGIVKTIKASLIRCLGNLYRYADVFPTKKLTFLKIERTRRRGRPPTGRLDNVEKDFKLMGINRWKVIVTDRVYSNRISESAVARKRLLSL